MLDGAAYACGLQFRRRAVPVEYPHESHTVFVCTNRVMAAIADHGRRSGIHGRLAQGKFEQIRFVDAGAVELRAEDGPKVPREVEVIENSGHEDPWLARGDVEFCSSPTQLEQHRFDARIDRILEKPAIGEALAIEIHSGLRIRNANERRKIFDQRWPDTPLELILGWNRSPEALEGILYTARNPRLRIGQRSIEIEEDVLIQRDHSLSA